MKLASEITKEERDSWRSPRWLFNWLHDQYEFDVDLAANDGNALTLDYITAERDALSVDWSYYWDRGYCNPPYSNIRPWIAKAIEQQKKGFTSVFVVPTPNGEQYYQAALARASSVTWITGRVAFVAPFDYMIPGKDGKPDRFIKKGQETGGNTRGTCVIEFAPITTSQEWRFKALHVSREELKKKFSNYENELL